MSHRQNNVPNDRLEFSCFVNSILVDVGPQFEHMQHIILLGRPRESFSTTKRATNAHGPTHRQNILPDSTSQTASGVSSGVGRDSQDDGSVEEDEGGTGATAARGRRGGGGTRDGNDERASSHLEASTQVTPAVAAAAAAAAAAHGSVREKSGAGGGRRRGRASSGAMEVWDFERLGRTPLLAAAFEDFSRKALCHESVLFLSEVSR